MTLREFLTRTGLTQTQFARMVDVSDVAVSRYVNGLRIPRKEHLRRIIEVTDGAVTPTDFVVETVSAQNTSRQGNC